MSTKTSTGAHSRAAAAQAIHAVLEQGQSLTQALSEYGDHLSAEDKRLAQAISYGVMRYLPVLTAKVSGKLDKPLKGKNQIIQSLLLVGTYQLFKLRTKDHAAVSATVEASKLLKRKALSGLVNGVLRQVLREAPARNDAGERELESTQGVNHPRWLKDKITAAYGEQAESVFAANDSQPPLWLRVNQRHTNVASYIDLLKQHEIEAVADEQAKDAIRLTKPVPVNKLPHFEAGWVSVQDRSAQLAADMVAAQPEHRVLDCCAAPGGKTVHLLERTEFQTPLIAIDVDEQRLERVSENLYRANLSCDVICADVLDIDSWWDKQPFDRILLDAPCSATGVIRRHPDIKWLRRSSDIEQLVELQQSMLERLWPILKPGGQLVYATCSILPEENSEQISRFLGQHSDANLVSIDANRPMLQLLPGEHHGDGFFYAKIEKLT
ncbi:16S rRNA m(5)C-967 methyltransferase [Idiomarina fontislapidosi]|uniref:16S rRNA (cytosine(967)-C(5))-methyltransferase n=1 Tax=Idiomarina fontislapidosi TaxID=263723 RepID=A0A432XP17_9GAMM|nr:16S rRNA (cytosine(967)-C(5))-methyltransferase RsmB [Idiomarina fontislapidosi]PYE30490.1 16S rRNA m(5)C-967 methyltransferase [Idiomarina fontislapidosi]RUO50422.1 16S rRNA (cytosine(967)-C(5))-methyltransferase RsmB [Idiomarina fontislapidosi]|tara:strand:- start:3995 stop:5308 length:1314 start_codon:yes stop_codon:yes gene_type:complete